MRKAQKKQAENFAELLGQAQEEIEKAIERNHFALAIQLLEQCQEGAIELGNVIAASEGENFYMISLLQEYCEEIYQIYQNVIQTPLVQKKQMYQKLGQLQKQIENSIKKDIKVHLEVVFLPYKASMWDSLESVWKAADADSNCDAYVIPIPYYDKNFDGSFGRYHYEGDQMPSDIPITYYKDYDMEKRRPDIIFIHNPYDNCNLVTSVHPLFYSENLKKYTEKLVYIPYFVLGEPSLGSKIETEKIEHFITLPAVIYSDQVIVQSEAMRQVYIERIGDFISDNRYTRKYWEGRIQGLGSPKFDKIINKTEEQIVPEEWKRVIKKRDGSLKKIVFYNTSINALLKYNEQILKKMQNVFKVFREQSDEIVLLWRPHPLIEATILSMRPQLWKQYKEILENYKEDGWGIYDDTAELDRAIKISDFYFGDSSSVIQLCKSIGIPVMLQNVEILI